MSASGGDGPAGLRERKKRRTRRHIADTAARLFGEHGYERVAVTDVARAAEVAPQTVYNYFPTKQDLVLDRDEEVRARLVGLVAGRAPGVTPAAALRPAAYAEIADQRARTRDESRGELPMLCATSATVRRLALEARDRQADAVAAAIVDTVPDVDPWAARAHAAALVSVFQHITDHAGRRLLDGAAPGTVADELVDPVDAALDDLDRRYRAPGAAARTE